MSVRSKKAAVALLLISVAILFFVYIRRGEVAGKYSNVSSEEVAAGMNTASAAAVKNAAVVSKTSSTSASSYQLPSIDKPIDEIFDQLKLASDKGEAKATCRLALELLKCQLSLKQDEEELEKDVTYKYRGKTEDELLDIRKFDLEALDFYRECKKISVDKLADTTKLLEQAANQGQLDAMVVWASGEWIKGRYGNSDAFLQDPAFRRWQQNAIPMMNRALQQGSYTAAREWIDALLFDDPLPFYSLIKNDPKKMYAFWTLSELLENDIPTPPRDLSARDARAAEAEGRRMFNDYFHGKPIGKDNLNKARVLLEQHGEDRRDLCNASP